MTINLTDDIKVGDFNYLSRLIGYGNIPNADCTTCSDVASV